MAAKKQIKVVLHEVDGETRELVLAADTPISQADPSTTRGDVIVYLKEAGNGWVRADDAKTLRNGDELMLQKQEGKFLS